MCEWNETQLVTKAVATSLFRRGPITPQVGGEKKQVRPVSFRPFMGIITPCRTTNSRDPSCSDLLLILIAQEQIWENRWTQCSLFWAKYLLLQILQMPTLHQKTPLNTGGLILSAPQSSLFLYTLYGSNPIPLQTGSLYPKKTMTSLWSQPSWKNHEARSANWLISQVSGRK